MPAPETSTAPPAPGSRLAEAYEALVVVRREIESRGHMAHELGAKVAALERRLADLRRITDAPSTDTEATLAAVRDASAVRSELEELARARDTNSRAAATAHQLLKLREDDVENVTGRIARVHERLANQARQTEAARERLREARRLAELAELEEERMRSTLGAELHKLTGEEVTP